MYRPHPGVSFHHLGSHHWFWSAVDKVAGAVRNLFSMR
jgi:hypothetical protein